MTIRTVIDTWSSAAVSVATSTDWFAADVSVGGSFPVKHMFQFMVPTATVVYMDMAKDGIEKRLEFNGGTALPANSGQNFGVIIWPGTTYNIQHVTETQNVSVIVSESDNLDL